MTGVLALVGGGEFSPGCSFDADLVADSGGRDVVVVPTAAAFENPSHLIERAEAWFAQLDASVRVLPVYRRADALEAEAASGVVGARFVYLAGGSAAHFRSTMLHTPVLDTIVAAWRDGAVLAASGAAAAALCSHMVDPRGGAFTVGLGLLDDLTVVPRFDTWSDERNRRTVRLAPAALPVLALDERTAAIRGRDGRWSFQGEGRVQVFLAGQAVNADVLPRG